MTDAGAGRLLRFGLDLVLDWADYVTARLHNWRDSRDGVRGELTITQNGVRYSWGAWNLASTVTRDQLAKRLTRLSPEIPWDAHLEEAAIRFTEAARAGEPLTVLTGEIDKGPEALLPGWLYAGEPTLLYADGDTGKSMTALTLALAMMLGIALPGGLVPARPVTAAYLDWETSQATTNHRLGLLASGFGVAPPPMLYKRMTRPLVEEIGSLSADLVRQRVGLVVIDSKMFAVAIGENAPFHEPITAFYSACRLFAPAAVLVLNHVTNADARTGSPARPFGGAFAFNGPRVIWEAKRDWEIEDATAIVFTCRKANNLAQKPPAFGLRFSTPMDNPAIQVSPLDLSSVQPSTLAGANLPARLVAMLSQPLSVEALGEALRAKPDSIARTLRRLKEKRKVSELSDGRWIVNPDMSGSVSGLSEPTGSPGPRTKGFPPHPLPKRTTPVVRSKTEANSETLDSLGFGPFGSIEAEPVVRTVVRTSQETRDWRGNSARTVSGHVSAPMNGPERPEPDWITEDPP